MAGNWIAMHHTLLRHPKVRKINRITGASSIHETIGRLTAVWWMADEHSDNGAYVGSTQDIDDEAECDGFGEAMIEAGWLEVNDDALIFPNFGDHNGKTAKRRLTDAKLKGQRRAISNDVRKVSAKCPQNVRNDADKMRTTVQDSTEQNSTGHQRKTKRGETPPPPADGFDWTTAPNGLDTPPVRDAMTGWIQYRRETKLRAWQKRTIAAKLNEFEGRPDDLVAAINHSIANGWQGVFEDKSKRTQHAAVSDSFNHDEDTSWVVNNPPRGGES